MPLPQTMARRKTVKVQKTSYAERVLGAMTQIQKEHRKHAIHLATLRAQIRKNAESKNDTLGPNWVQWVGKAIHKLTDDGVIETPNAQEVAFTSEGKHIITATKRAVPEDDLWRQVSSKISRGRKRPRSSVGLNQDASISASGTKRPRRASGFRSFPTTPTRTSKAQPTVAFRDLSPLTDISDDDVNDVHEEDTVCLKAQLQGKDSEIEKLRSRLEALRRQQPDTAPSSRHATPDLGGLEVTTATLRQVGKGITRTQSGSIIPDISKQPTPAPSDFGDDPEGFGWMRSQTPTPPGIEEGRGEPWPTPASARHRTGQATFPVEGRTSRRQPGVNGGDADGNMTNAARRQQQVALAGRVEDLERRLVEGEAAISGLRVLKEDLEAKNSSLQEEVASIKTSLADESASRQRATLEIVARHNDLVTLRSALSALQADRDLVALQSRQEQEGAMILTSQHTGAKRKAEAVRAELDEAMGKIGDLTEQSIEKDATIAQKEANLATAAQEIKVCHDRIRQRENENSALLLELDRVKGSNEELAERLSCTQTKLASAEAALGEAHRLAGEKDTALVRITEKLANSEASQAKLEGRLEASEMDLRSVHARLQSSEGVVESLKEDSRAKDTVVLELSAELADAERRVATAEEQRLVSEKSNGEAQQELNGKISVLEMTISSDLTEIEGLNLKLGETGVQLEEMRASLVGARAEELRVRMELESEKVRAQLLQEEKMKMEQKVELLKLKTKQLTEQVDQGSKTIEVLKTSIAGYRQSQIRSLDDLSQMVASAGLANSSIHNPSSLG